MDGVYQTVWTFQDLTSSKCFLAYEQNEDKNLAQRGPSVKDKEYMLKNRIKILKFSY